MELTYVGVTVPCLCVKPVKIILARYVQRSFSCMQHLITIKHRDNGVPQHTCGGSTIVDAIAVRKAMEVTCEVDGVT